MDGFFSEYLTYGLYFMDKFLLIFVSPVLVCVLGDIIDKFGIFDAGILEQVVWLQVVGKLLFYCFIEFLFFSAIIVS